MSDESDETEKPKGPILSMYDALAWVSSKLIEVMVQREAVELASLILRSAGIDEGRRGRSGEDESVYSKTWAAIRQANGIYGEALAEWFGLFLAVREHDESTYPCAPVPEGEEPKPPRPAMHEVLDEIRAQAMMLLNARLHKHIQYEQTHGLSWLGESRLRMTEVVLRVIRHGKDPSQFMAHDAPREPVEAAGRILRMLGCQDDVTRNTLQKALRSAGVAPEARVGSGVVDHLSGNAPDGQQEAALRVLKALGYTDKVACEVLDQVLRSSAGLAPNATAEDLRNRVWQFEDSSRRGSPKDAQEAAYRVLRILGYDAKIAEEALAKSLGFVTPTCDAEVRLE